MEEFKAGELVVLLRAMREATGNGTAIGWPTHNWLELKKNIQSVCEELEKLNLPVTLEKAQMALEVLENETGRGHHQEYGEIVTLDGLPLLRYNAATSDAVGRFRSEMGSRYAFALDSAQSALFRDSRKMFDQAILDAFPSVEAELEEAAKCFVLGRHTASVFHGMRSLEAGLDAICKELGIDLQANWNTALNLIEAEIRSRNRGTHGPDWIRDEPFFAEAATYFRFLKNAWRNHTMHLKESYSEERARSVLSNVAGFMLHLSGRLSE